MKYGLGFLPLLLFCGCAAVPTAPETSLRVDETTAVFQLAPEIPVVGEAVRVTVAGFPANHDGVATLHNLTDGKSLGGQDIVAGTAAWSWVPAKTGEKILRVTTTPPTISADRPVIVAARPCPLAWSENGVDLATGRGETQIREFLRQNPDGGKLEFRATDDPALRELGRALQRKYQLSPVVHLGANALKIESAHPLLRVREPFRLTATLQNLGALDAKNVKIVFSVNHSIITTRTVDIPAFRANEKPQPIKISIDCGVRSPGVRNFRVEVEPAPGLTLLDNCAELLTIIRSSQESSQ